MDKLLQSGDNDLPISFYDIALRFIKARDKVLNLGSGIKFNFESLLKERKKERKLCG